MAEAKDLLIKLELADAQIDRLKRDLKDCRNELCLYCGKYKERNNGACCGCRWRPEDGSIH